MIRGISAGQDSISPNRHLEINDIGSLLDMIDHLREVTGKPVGFKIMVGAYGWLGTMAEEVHRCGIKSLPDFITSASINSGEKRNDANTRHDHYEDYRNSKFCSRA